MGILWFKHLVEGESEENQEDSKSAGAHSLSLEGSLPYLDARPLEAGL